MTLELGRTPTQRICRGWTSDHRIVVRTNHNLFQDAFLAELKKLQDERRAIIDAGGPAPPPPIHKDEVWTRIEGSRKRGGFMACVWFPRINTHRCLGILTMTKLLMVHPNIRSRLLCSTGRFHSRGSAYAQRVAVVEAVCAKKVRNMESIVQTQSQDVSKLRKAYSDMYSFLTQMRSSGSSAMAMPDMPPRPPPAQSQSLPPQPNQGTGSPLTDDDPDYV
ncbi:hypothetical protein PIB30_094500 [Stylosanthes scabra]|uniref:Uncharacterized protein n=1 Tax=Stylosanthes scabra TaxID=79078 RepID=A0ABU6TW79_9FABA|nr:hypothetical protein [Stylosanthes scabra]